MEFSAPVTWSMKKLPAKSNKIIELQASRNIPLSCTAISLSFSPLHQGSLRGRKRVVTGSSWTEDREGGDPGSRSQAGLPPVQTDEKGSCSVCGLRYSPRLRTRLNRSMEAESHRAKMVLTSWMLNTVRNRLWGEK